MTEIPVLWLSNHGATPPKGYWDQAMLEALFDRTLWRVPGGVTFEHYQRFDDLPVDAEFAVVVVPARHHADPDDVRWLRDVLADLPSSLLILTGDEERVFPVEAFEHGTATRRVWVQTPRAGETEMDMALGDGWPPRCRDLLSNVLGSRYGVVAKRAGWFFAGQVTHPQRQACADAMRACSRNGIKGTGVFTNAFGSGMPYHMYLEGLAQAKVAPCPGGPATPDTFRLFEALEAACVPVVLRDPYWRTLFGAEPPFPQLGSWDELPTAVDEILTGWPANANRVQAWWQAEKRRLAYRLEDDIADLVGAGSERSTSTGAAERQPKGAGDFTNRPSRPRAVSDQVTVVMTTSPVPSHPSTTGIEETVKSIRSQPGLEGAEILILCDGVWDDQEHRRGDYEEYLRRLLALSARRWANVLPVLFDEHVHQAGMLRRGLEMVTTPLMLFVEHDTPLVGVIDWSALCDAVSSGEANVVRLSHEASILPEHAHLAVDGPEERRNVCGAPMIRTAQWSQRPHLASTAFYRSILPTYFGAESSSFIEEVLYGALDAHWRILGRKGWEEFSVWIYAPDPDGSGLGYRRSGHSDLRGSDPKADCRFRYDGPVPLGAPNPVRDEVPA